MSALAQRTYQSYFDRNEWSGSPINNVFDDGYQDFAYSADCEDGAIGYAIRRTDECVVDLVDIAGVSATLSSGTHVLHDHLKSSSIRHWVVLSKPVQRRAVTPLARTEDIAIKFSVLVDLWRKDTEFSSSPIDIIEHSAYREIVSWGARAVPLILRDLALNGGHWFQALQELTNENPVNPADAGRIKKMREAWLDWGRENKII